MNLTTHPVEPAEIMAYLDGELAPERSAVVTNHLGQCEACRFAASDLRLTSRQLGAWKVEGTPGNLDTRVLAAVRAAEGGDPGARRPQGFRPLLSRPWLWVAACTAVVVVALGLFLPGGMCPRKGVSLPVPPKGLETFVPLPAQTADKGAATRAGGGGGDGARDLDMFVPQAPMIARTVELSITMKDYAVARSSLDAILARHHGYAAELTASTEQGAARSLHASLRIPAGELAAAVQELKALGRVETETQKGEEVTAQHADLVARLKNARETELRLQDVLRTRTGKVADILAVEQEIARVRGEIEQMEAEQKALEHRVDFATVELKLTEEYKAPLGSSLPSIPTRLRNGLVEGYRDAVESVVGFVVFLASYGPTVLIWGFVLFWPARMAWRRWRRLNNAIGA